MSAPHGARSLAGLSIAVVLAACGAEPRAGVYAPPAPVAAREAVPPAPARASAPAAEPDRVAALPPERLGVAKRPADVAPPAVAPQPPRPRRPYTAIDLPHHDGMAPSAALHDTTVVGDARLGCVYVVFMGRRLPGVWPPGYHARFAPLRIYDERDREVWREGELRVVGGGVTQVVHPIPERCRLDGGAWLLGRVRTEPPPP